LMFEDVRSELGIDTIVEFIETRKMLKYLKKKNIFLFRSDLFLLMPM
jgi:EAL domain-containing protein (putative c-di-GMP-specific phosphodiesterase class I)